MVGTEPGFGPEPGTPKSPEKRFPGIVAQRRAGRRMRADLGRDDTIAVTRARIAAYVHALRQSQEAQLVQLYAAKLAAVAMCAQPAQRYLMLEALRDEREAALSALRAQLAAFQRAQQDWEVGLLRSRRVARRRTQNRRRRLQEFIRVANAACSRTRPKPHRPRPARSHRTARCFRAGRHFNP